MLQPRSLRAALSHLARPTYLLALLPMAQACTLSSHAAHDQPAAKAGNTMRICSPKLTENIYKQLVTSTLNDLQPPYRHNDSVQMDRPQDTLQKYYQDILKAFSIPETNRPHDPPVTGKLKVTTDPSDTSHHVHTWFTISQWDSDTWFELTGTVGYTSVLVIDDESGPNMMEGVFPKRWKNRHVATPWNLPRFDLTPVPNIHLPLFHQTFAHYDVCGNNGMEGHLTATASLFELALMETLPSNRFHSITLDGEGKELDLKLIKKLPHPANVQQVTIHNASIADLAPLWSLKHLETLVLPEEVISQHAHILEKRSTAYPVPLSVLATAE